MRTLERAAHEITTKQQGTVTFFGSLIGHATSEATRHNHAGETLAPTGHSDRDRKGPRPSCSACRWFEAELYQEIYQGQVSGYVIHTIGRSIVPGEIDYARVLKTDSAFEVVELMTVRQKGAVFLPAPSSRALAQASSVDDDIREAYINRAVV
jgi:hypothetical protein